MNSLQLKKRAFLAAISQVKGIKATKLGVFPLSLSGCVGDDSIVDYKIHGSTGGVGELTDGKYTIPIVTHGKNVFDITKCTTYNADKGGIYLSPKANRDNAEGRVDTVTDMQVGRPYVITGTSTSSSGYFVYLRGTQKIWWWGQSYTPQEADFNERIYFYKCTGTSDPEITQEVIISNVQIEQGTAATDYESYHAPITTVITLPEPLGAGDYISYSAQAIIHADGTKTSVSLPKIPTYKGTTILECNTTTAPEGVEITYYTNNEED